MTKKEEKKQTPRQILELLLLESGKFYDSLYGKGTWQRGIFDRFGSRINALLEGEASHDEARDILQLLSEQLVDENGQHFMTADNLLKKLGGELPRKRNGEENSRISL